MTGSKEMWWPLKPPGGAIKQLKIQIPKEPDPSPQPISGREEEEAKKKARQRARRSGREQNILAGRLTSRRNDILKTMLG